MDLIKKVQDADSAPTAALVISFGASSEWTNLAELLDSLTNPRDGRSLERGPQAGHWVARPLVFFYYYY